MPVAPYDNLLEKYSSAGIDQIINSFTALKEACEKAINETDDEKASAFLIEVFGDRFVNVEVKESSDKSFAILVNASIPKPWRK